MTLDRIKQGSSRYINEAPAEEEECEPRDGFYQQDHKECEKCSSAQKRLCQYFQELHWRIANK